MSKHLMREHHQRISTLAAMVLAAEGSRASQVRLARRQCIQAVQLHDDGELRQRWAERAPAMSRKQIRAQ